MLLGMKAYERAKHLLEQARSGDTEALQAFRQEAPSLVEALVRAFARRPSPEDLARKIYALHEQLAARYECDAPIGWEEEPINNKRLLVAVSARILDLTGGDTSGSEDILQALEKANPDAGVLFGLEEAIIGIVDLPDRPPELAYDFAKCVRIMSERQGVSCHEAALALNTINAVFVHR